MFTHGHSTPQMGECSCLSIHTYIHTYIHIHLLFKNHIYVIYTYILYIHTYIHTYPGCGGVPGGGCGGHGTLPELDILGRPSGHQQEQVLRIHHKQASIHGHEEHRYQGKLSTTYIHTYIHTYQYPDGPPFIKIYIHTFIHTYIHT